MAFLEYEYKMQVKYESPVSKCYFTVKCIPTLDLRQQPLSCEISINPETNYSFASDSFGNKTIIGSEMKPHDYFDLTVKGRVETQKSSLVSLDNSDNQGMYKYSYGKCILGRHLEKMVEKIEGELNPSADDQEKARYVMSEIYNSIIYKPNLTDTTTTAEEAMELTAGVCQDYAHIMITILRALGIPARYACGFLIGEGKSHAWVEFLTNNRWYALDPTNNCVIDENYIKLGSGRDALDCSINRGTIWGGGKQEQIINLTVRKIYS